MEKVKVKLNEILSDCEKLNEADSSKFERLSERVKGVAINSFGTASLYNEKIDLLQNRVRMAFFGFNVNHAKELTNIIQMMLDEIELNEHKGQYSFNRSNNDSNGKSNFNSVNGDNQKIFIVHGHNDVMKLATARTIERLGLKPIILHEQANAGDTLIEKFTRNSDVGFAVVLLSADDYGYAKTESHTSAKLRARQNVILELGFFYGKLGRKRVVAIFEQTSNFEKPSDIDGVIYIPYNASDSKWQFDLAKELLEVGYQIDANMLIR